MRAAARETSVVCWVIGVLYYEHEASRPPAPPRRAKCRPALKTKKMAGSPLSANQVVLI